MSSLASPERNWWKPIGKAEKVWVIIALFWGLVLFAMMFIWMGLGKQNIPLETYRISSGQFLGLANKFIEEYKVGEEKGIPVVEPPDSADIYLIARMWQWSPILKLKQGKTYRIHLSSIDVSHGFSIQPINLNLQVLPGYDYVIKLTPTTTGEYFIVCNEFCGLGHHNMIGKIIVTG
ncbi:MAG: cytochrome C oxidase subunit II [Thermodesulfobacteriota bacterium]